jgi:hypothetical protein
MPFLYNIRLPHASSVQVAQTATPFHPTKFDRSKFQHERVFFHLFEGEVLVHGGTLELLTILVKRRTVALLLPSNRSGLGKAWEVLPPEDGRKG